MPSIAETMIQFWRTPPHDNALEAIARKLKYSGSGKDNLDDLAAELRRYFHSLQEKPDVNLAVLDDVYFSSAVTTKFSALGLRP